MRPSVVIGGRARRLTFCRSLRVVGGFPAGARLNRDLEKVFEELGTHARRFLLPCTCSIGTAAAKSGHCRGRQWHRR